MNLRRYLVVIVDSEVAGPRENRLQKIMHVKITCREPC